MLSFNNTLQIKRNFVEAANKWREGMYVAPSLAVGSSPTNDIGTIVGKYPSSFTILSGATGFPVWLLRLIDLVYDKYKYDGRDKEARDFVVNYFEAMPVGADLSHYDLALNEGTLLGAIRTAKSAAEFVQEKRARMYDPLIDGLAWADEASNALTDALTNTSISGHKADKDGTLAKFHGIFANAGQVAKNNSIAIYGINSDIHMALSGCSELALALISEDHFTKDVLGFMHRIGEIYASAAGAKDTLLLLPKVNPAGRIKLREHTIDAFYRRLGIDMVNGVRHLSANASPSDMDSDAKATMNRWSHK